MEIKFWMNDPELETIEPSKLDFIQKIIFELNKLNEQEKLPYLLALSKKMQKQKISFTAEETSTILKVLEKHVSKEEIDKAKKMLLLMKK